MRVALLVAVAAVVLLLPNVPATPPLPGGGFDQPQSAPLPAPFPVKLVDQGQFDPAFKGYYLPEGFRMEVVARDPDVVNPVGITFGPDGELFVLEWRKDPVMASWNEVKETFRYRDGSTRLVATMKKFITDWVKQLRYDPATGTFGSMKIVIADELPSSVLHHDGWLYLSGRGTVRRFRQSLPNGKWDIRETIAQGFCGFHHHQVSGLTLGHDGRLYITTGDDDNAVEGSDGSRANALRTGAVFRCMPDGSKMELFSLGYRNPYRDVAMDAYFNLFHTDNDNEDGSRFMGCRIMHIAEGVDYGWRLKEGVRCCRPDLVRSAVAGELPGRLAPMLKTGRGAPAGMLIYNDTYLPEHYRGLMYYPDVFRKVIRAYGVEPAGSTFKITSEFEFMKSDDPLFRPCQMVTGPDGAIYVCDWRTDSGGAGKLWGNGETGRIYRIRWDGTPDTPKIAVAGWDRWSKIRKLSDEKLVEVLAAENFTDRMEARKELVKRGPRVRDAVKAVFANVEAELTARLTALAVLNSMWDAEVETLVRGRLRDAATEVRRLSADAIALNSRPADEANHSALLQQMNDPEPSVRRAVALALGHVGSAGVGEALVNAYKGEEANDPFLRDAFIRAIEFTGKAGINAVLQLAQSGDNTDRDLAIRIFSALRIRPAAEALPEMLAYPHLTVPQREVLIRSFANYQLDPPISFDPLAAFMAKRSEEPKSVVQAAIEVLSTSSGTAGPAVKDWLIQLLSQVDSETRLDVIAALDTNRVVEASPTLLTMLVDDRRSLAERKALLRAVRVTKNPEAATTIEALLREREPPMLRVEALRTLAALEPARALTAAEKLLDQKDEEVLAEAVAVLGATASGAKLVGQRFQAGKLPKDLLPLVTDALQKFESDAEAGRLRLEIMKGGLLVSLDAEQVKKVMTLVETKGNARKGRDLFLNTKLLACASCHRLEGTGGYVGPDLTRVWDTQSVEKLLESILAPGKEIKEGYQTYRLVTAKGQTITGLRVLDTTKETVIRDASGRDIHVAKDDIEELSPSKVSLMPEDAVARLSFDQFIDLLAFLKSKREQESLRGSVPQFAVSGPTSTEFSEVPAELRSDPLGKAGGPWHLRAVAADGLLTLKEDFPAKPAGLHLRFWVFSQKEQRVTATVIADVPAKGWLNGRSAFEQRADKPGLQETSFDLDLDRGWNVVLLKASNASANPRLGMRLQGEGLRTLAKPEAVATPSPGKSSE